MSSRPELRLDWCTHEAAKYAVENWHYSKSMPAFKTVKLGVWENGKFIGAVIYGMGANPNLHKPYGIGKFEVAELVRVALFEHSTPVSKILAVAQKLLKKQSPNLRLIVSYADTDQGHHGGIYQACNWIYAGDATGGRSVWVLGQKRHPKSIHSLGWVQSEKWLKENVDPQAKIVLSPPKHRYLMPLDDEMRAKIEPLRKPYPKRVRSEDSGTVGIQPVGGGANPTRTLTPENR